MEKKHPFVFCHRKHHFNDLTNQFYYFTFYCKYMVLSIIPFWPGYDCCKCNYISTFNCSQFECLIYKQAKIICIESMLFTLLRF